jgi:hypothetical protein
VGAEKVADDAFAAAKELQPSLEGEALAVQGHPADVLLVQASDAALIVKTLTMRAGDTLRVKYERHGSSHTTVVTLTP